MPTVVPVTVRPHNADAVPDGFLIDAPNGGPLLVAQISAPAIREARVRWRGPRLPWSSPSLRSRSSCRCHRSSDCVMRFHTPTGRLKVIGSVIGASGGRAGAPVARADGGVDRSDLPYRRRSAPGLRALLRTPVDFLLTMALLAALVVLAFDSTERLRRTVRQRRPPPADATRLDGLRPDTARLRAQLVALLLVGYEVLLGNAICGDVGRRAALLAAPSRFRATRVRPRADAGAGRRLLGGHPFRRADVGSVAHVSHRAASPWRDLRCRRSRSLSLRFSRGRSARPHPRSPHCRRHSPGCHAWASRGQWRGHVPAIATHRKRCDCSAGALVLLIPAFVLYPSVHHFADRGLTPPRRRGVRAPGGRPAGGAAEEALDRSAADRSPRHVPT